MTAVIAESTLTTAHSISSDSLQLGDVFPTTVGHVERADRLLRCEIEFIPNQEFQAAASNSSLAREILSDDWVEPESDSNAVPQDLPPHLAVMCESRLLHADEERHLFRKMNYLKFRANSIRVTLNPDALDIVALEQAEEGLAAARMVRDRIVRANMRLVISVVKKFVTQQVSFDELLSEGVDTLMNAVEKFDYDRGFRFSTYAYRSIARHSYRVVTDRQKDSSRFMTGSDAAEYDAEEVETSSLNERTWNNLRRLLSSMMNHLDRREQFIIRGRYALGAHRKVRSFQCLADKLGISKERVRQLESRAVNKLRAMAAKHDPDNMIETLSFA